MEVSSVTTPTSTGNQSLPLKCLSNDIAAFYLILDHQQSDLFYTKGQALLIQVLYPLVAAFGFIGNTAFLVVLVYVREMYTVTNFYLGNLAISDTMVLTCILSVITFFRELYGSHGFANADNVGSAVGCIGPTAKSSSTCIFLCIFRICDNGQLRTFLCRMLSNLVSQ